MGLCLFFLPNFPGATFIQGGTFIPDSRVISRTANEDPLIVWHEDYSSCMR